MRKVLFMLLLLGVGLLAIERGLADHPSTAPATRSSAARESSPIKYQQIVWDKPAIHLHLITVDLTDPRVRLKVCRAGDDPDGDGPWQTTIKPVRAIAQANQLEVAVNGNYFRCKDVQTFAGRKIPYYSGNWAIAMGFGMTDGNPWSETNSGGHTLTVDRAGRVIIGKWWPKVPPGTWQAMGGSELLVLDGKAVSTGMEVAPRTAVGVNEDNTKLYLLVVDGRREGYSLGLTGPEMAKYLIDIGCWRAINLDGGGSATMVMRDPIDGETRVINRPSDGHDLPISLSIERPVASAFGVQLIEPNSDKSDAGK